MTEAEYLEFDLAHEGKHEFVDGELVAMAGATEEHVLACANLVRALGNLLRGTPCRVYTSDLRVRIDETGLYAYSDVTVVCGRATLAPTHPPSLLNPRCIVEVLSDSTEGYDRGPKAAHYRRRPSIDTLVFVSTRERRVEVHTRREDGEWTLAEATDGQISLPALGVNLALDEVFSDFDALATPGG